MTLETFHKIYVDISVTGLGFLKLVTDWEDIMDRFKGWFKIKTIYERRHNVIKYLKLLPVLEKLATDLEAAAKSPEDQAVAADVRTLIADIGSANT